MVEHKMEISNRTQMESLSYGDAIEALLQGETETRLEVFEELSQNNAAATHMSKMTESQQKKKPP